jgi:hypothetical protein
MGESSTVVVDPSEIAEACALLEVWKPRLAELPRLIREEVLAVTILPLGKLVEPLIEAGEITLVLAPRLRALVGNLRARL